MLLQNRKGTWASRRRASAWAAPGVGVGPTSSVPEMSMRRARSGGRHDVLAEALLTVLSGADIDLGVRFMRPEAKVVISYSS